MERLHVGDGHAALHRFTYPMPAERSRFDGADHVDGSAPAGRCLLVPPFGVEAAALAPVGAALEAQGFEALAFDPRNHVGDGSGSITDFRLSTFTEDCRAALAAVQPTCLVAVSLGARAAIRALADGPAAPSAVLITPVVDLRHTLHRVLGRDWFKVPARDVPPLESVLGFDIGGPQFLHDAMANDFVSTDRTVRDLSAFHGLMTALPGTADPWVDPSSVAHVVDRARLATRARIRWVECDRHTFHEDPELAIRIIGAAVDEIVDLHRPGVLLP